MADSHDTHIDDYLVSGTDADIAATYHNLPKHAQEMAFGLFEDDVIILDTETTGLDPTRDMLLEIAAVRMAGPDIVSEFQTFVDPGRPIPEEVSELTGISQEDVKGAPGQREAVQLLAQFAGNNNLIAHNADFDRSFIMREAQPGVLMGSWIDTLALSRICLPRFRSHRLVDLAHAFGLHAPTHRAADDTRALAALWRILLAAIQSMTPGLSAYIATLSPQADWPLRSYFAQAAEETPGIDFSLRQARDTRLHSASIVPRQDADDVALKFCTDDEIETAFGVSGLAGSMYASYEQREEQVSMAKEVAASLREEDLRVLEAGTGVGKSMAYLLPCALGAKENNITIGVATKTNALMDQLVYRELPRLAATLGELSYVALKGYDHYPCLRKIEHMAHDDEDDAVSIIQMVAMLLSYITQTSWGDLDTLNLHWPGLPRGLIQANPHDCLKKRCPFFPRRCYLHGARRAANGADIVVTNHALLFRDMQADNGILPPIRHWVIDEAHSVEAEARRQLSYSISSRDLEITLMRIGNQKNGIISQVRNGASKVAGGDILFGITADIENRIATMQSLTADFFSNMKTLSTDEARDGGSYTQITAWIGEELRNSGSWVALCEIGRDISDRLMSLSERLRDLISMIEQFEGAFSNQLAALSSLTSEIKAANEALSLVLDGTDKSFVYSAQFDRNPQRSAEVLRAEQLDIGKTLASSFYPQVKSAIFTSATLATGDAKPFAHFLRATGLDLIDEERVSTRILASGYDFNQNMTIFLPSDMPEPNDRHYHAELARLLKAVHVALGGSVLTLFTNRREMEAFYQELKPSLQDEGLEVIAQTRGTSTKHLHDRFLADKGLSLFALKSFWEGFDAPGDTLRCVIIVRLPFARPSDPIAREREARESRTAWRNYSLPEAVVDLKQAAGRLIRNSTDSGWLVLADARLQTRNYAKSFLRAMPTQDIRTLSTDEITQTMKNETPGFSKPTLP